MTSPEGEDLETSFAREGLERCRRGARLYAGFAIAMLLLSAVDSAIAESAQFAPLLRVRAVAILAVAAVLGTLATRLGERRPRELMLLLTLIMALTLHELALLTGGQASTQYDRMNLLVLAPAILMSWSFSWSLTACAVIVGVYVAGSAANGGLAAPPFSVNLGRLFAASIVTTGAGLLRERNRWRELARLHSLAAARERADREIRRLNEELEHRVHERTADLRTSEERFRTMFEHAPIGVVTLEGDGRLRQVNQSFATMLGYGRSDLEGVSIADVTVWEDRARSVDMYRKLRDGEISEGQFEKRYVRRDGAVVPAHVAVAAVRDGSGRFSYALGMVQDVSDRVRAEERASEHREQLAHVLRVSTMGEMAAQLAHELNQPLGAIVNYANGACTRLRDRGAEPEMVDAVARIAAEGMRAAQIIGRVRQFLRRSAGLRESADVNELVRDAASLLETDARRAGIPVRLRLDPGLPAISLDRIQVEQVILNLLRNALDAMNAAPRPDHELVAETAAHNGFVEVRVRDTGIGVLPDTADRIFDAFFTSKPNGLGMGLSISRSIVEAHGGKLSAVANGDRGMTFAFSLAREK